jgi:uncharacterized membrane protein
VSGPTEALERSIGRLLTTATYVAVTLIAVGTGLAVAAGISPLRDGPPLEPSTLPSRLTQLQPDGFLWLGLLAVIAAPIARVIAAGVAFARIGDRWMTGVAVAIVAVIAVAVASSLLGG